jgi:hypothetical protein
LKSVGRESLVETASNAHLINSHEAGVDRCKRAHAACFREEPARKLWQIWFPPCGGRFPCLTKPIIMGQSPNARCRRNMSNGRFGAVNDAVKPFTAEEKAWSAAPRLALAQNALVLSSWHHWQNDGLDQI